MRYPLFVISLLLALLVATAPRAAFAQAGQQGSITGTVVDAQGGALPGVTVTVVHQGTNVTSTAVTNAAGVYLIPALPIGTYRVTFTMAQFNTVTRDIDMRAGDRLRLDQALGLGGVAEEVQVTSETPLLDTASATRSTIIERAQIEALPINGRNVFQLVHLTPGVLDDGANRASISRRPFDNGGMDGFSINGGVARSNLFLLEGSSNSANEGGSSGSLAFVPPVEAVEQVSVSSNIYDAQYGRTGGGVVSASVRSGTNRLSGSGAYMYRNSDMTAQLYQSRGQDKADIYHYNPVFTLGGPVRLPGYDGRDKTFFFGSYEYLKSLVEAGGGLSRAPTDLESACLVSDSPCDFSQSGMQGPLINPFTREPFPDQQIPASMVDPVSRAIFGFMRRPNTAPDASLNNFRPEPNLDGSFFPSTSRGDVYWSALGKVTQNLGNHRMFVTFGHNTRHEYRVKNGLNEDTASGTPHHYRWNYNLAFDWTTPIGTTMISTFKAGWVQHSRRDGENSRFDSSTLGFSSNYLGLIPRKDFFHPISVTDYGAADIGTAPAGFYTKSNLFTVSQLFTKILGQHQIKFGGEYGLNRDDAQTGGVDGVSLNAFNFNRRYTSTTPTANNPAAAAGGNSFASFVLGLPASGQGTLAAMPLLQWDAGYVGTFVQDDWRVSRRLTVNLGLRWDYEWAPKVSGDFVIGDFVDQQNPLGCPLCAEAAARPDIAGARPDGGAGLASLVGGPEFATGRIFRSDFNNFGPRVGATYALTDKLVLRTGYGLSYLSGLTNRGTTAGITRATPLVASNDNFLTPRTNLSETIGVLYPDGFLQPTGRETGMLTNIGANITYTNPNRRMEAYHSWNAGFQYELPWRSKIDVNYVGSRTVNRPLTLQRNDLSLDQLALGDEFLDEQVPNPFVGLLPGTGFNAATIQRRQLLRPYPQFGNVAVSQNPLGKLYFGSLQTTWDKRLSQGVSLLVSYTLSKAEQLTSPLNQGGPLYRQLTVDHRPHVFRVSGSWNTPSLASRNAILRGVAGDWVISGVTTWSVGRTVAMPEDVDLVGDPVLGNPTKQRWFNTCTLSADGVTRSNCASETEAPAFQLRANNAPDTTGSRLEGVYPHSPLLMDASVTKSIRAAGLSYQVRLDVYNVFNTVQWGGPNTDATSTAFGTVGDNQANDARFVMLTLKMLF